MHKFKTWLVSFLLRSYRHILFKKALGFENYKKISSSEGPVIFCVWHGHLLPASFVFKGMTKHKTAGMVSQSKDGDFMTKYSNDLGIDIVRGSSSKGGVKALLKVGRMIDNGYDCIMALDGPRGPAFEVKAGTVFLAKKTGRPLMPLIANCERAFSFSSWDRAFLPKPFSKTELYYCEPIYLSDDMSDEAVERDRKMAEQKILELTRAYSSNHI